MKASETEFKKIIEGTTQFFVPHYQRAYSWGPKQWQQLWEDLVSLVEERAAQGQDGVKSTHFIGSMVTTPGSSVPQGVAKYVLIDGQQRITTLMLLLAVFRDVLRDGGDTRRAEMVHNLYLTNQYQENNEHYKLLPTQGEDVATSDRTAFMRVISPDAGPRVQGHPATAAYEFFAKKIRASSSPKPDILIEAATSGLILVSIVLDRDDNPYTIFESLNAKGRPLAEADLIRNYFFMRIHQSDHERAYRQLWQPMERMLVNASMTEFFRQYLMRDGTLVKSDSVYVELKRSIDRRTQMTSLEQLQEVHRYAGYYARMAYPEREPNLLVRQALTNLQRLNFGVTSSFLLNLYEDFVSERTSPTVMAQALAVLENYLLRRFICGMPSNALNKIFPALYRQTREDGRFSIDRLKALLADKGYPSDEEFKARLAEVRLYGGGDRRDKAKFILDRLEQSFEHKEPVDTSRLTIEHVMPQTLSAAWESQLGPDIDELFDVNLHRLGNLTLTGYNSELSNAPYAEKREKLAGSHIELNRHFQTAPDWNFAAIEKRSNEMAERALKIWPSFRAAKEGSPRPRGVVTGTKPSILSIADERHDVKDWSEVLLETMKYLCATRSDQFPVLQAEFSKVLAEDPKALRSPRKLDNGYFYEANMSAQRIYKICEQIMDFVGCGDQWSVETRV